MFTKNIKDFFSDDLLNTVRSVVSEEKKKKHEKNCGCDECETEMKEEKRGLWDNIHAKRKRIKAGSGERMRKPGSKGAPSDADFKAASEEVEIEDIAEISNEKVTSYLRATARTAKSPADSEKRKRGAAMAIKKLTKEEQDFIDALNNDALEEGQKPYVSASSGGVGRSAGAHVLDSAGNTVKSFHKKEHGADYMKKANAYLKKNYNKMMKNEATVDTADIEKKKMISANDKSKIASLAAMMAKEKKPVKEDVELEEGRGRPPKEGSAAWKARQGKADDDMVALGMQLRKAQSINKKVRFMDSKEHNIHPNHINRFNDHMAARRTTQEKAAFQKQAHKSHADFVKAVSAPVPKASKDTGEIVKYR